MSVLTDTSLHSYQFIVTCLLVLSHMYMSVLSDMCVSVLIDTSMSVFSDTKTVPSDMCQFLMTYGYWHHYQDEE